MGQINGFMQKMICAPIRLYQYLLSPLIKPCCRFYPSCSQYALQAVEHYGISKGLWLACRRLLRCHPWSPGGYDPVLPNNEEKL
ncbi:membrane protein insertion efficiency factor YidD [Legionella nagasakiensis]|uniref:membrane protein insertion efficiency factor YidD n=1 Tax=Legionella nagasakiensis TaxID=535290 RepID=UPI00105663DC|nr:membrane protein insertion efficiency factor YidD [Legionella nagasakiensis]